MPRGRILYVDRNTVWLAQGRYLLRSTDGGQNWDHWSVLLFQELRDLLVVHRIGQRLGRVGFHHLAVIGPELSVIVAHRHIFKMQPGVKRLERLAPLVGNRPLTLCAADGIVCYGEYRRNADRSPVHVWAASFDDLGIWEPIWRFEGIRHIHGIFFDTYSKSFWVTTGDNDNESGIWVTRDHFRTLDQVVGGTQQLRAIQLLFSDKYVYFGSDTPNEINHIYRLEPLSGHVEPLTAVGGSIFYGCKVDGCFFFSTAVEPSEVNRSRYVEVWGSADGITWQIVHNFYKDRWPFKYFQYGQVTFPSGPGDGRNLWCTPMATTNDQKILKVEVASLFNNNSWPR